MNKRKLDDFDDEEDIGNQEENLNDDFQSPDTLTGECLFFVFINCETIGSNCRQIVSTIR